MPFKKKWINNSDFDFFWKIKRIELIGLDGFSATESRYSPEFERPLPNQMVTLGGEAVLSCHVAHLGGYKVG